MTDVSKLEKQKDFLFSLLNENLLSKINIQGQIEVSKDPKCPKKDCTGFLKSINDYSKRHGVCNICEKHYCKRCKKELFQDKHHRCLGYH